MGQPIEHPQDHSFLPRNGFKGSIEFKNVTFTYPGQQEPVLDDVSFKINAEENVAILGHVGSGKTTIGRLVAGLYEPDSGVILIQFLFKNLFINSPKVELDVEEVLIHPHLLRQLSSISYKIDH